ncbi:sce7725 family protein [Photobacterium sp. Hal280]|uniref:sce7725 family protein n=1 Tax=Photobacterium sp. Hal280 TaxID=3035163 RepID=UPI00301D3D6B
MYFPYLRGKQFDLGALKDVAQRLHPGKVRPIIEPVRKNINPLIAAVKKLNSHGITPIVIINAEVGDLKSESLQSNFSLLHGNGAAFLPCVRINNTNAQQTIPFLNQLDGDGILSTSPLARQFKTRGFQLPPVFSRRNIA